MGTKSDLCELSARTKRLESHVDGMRLTLRSIELGLRMDDDSLAVRHRDDTVYKRELQKQIDELKRRLSHYEQPCGDIRFDIPTSSATYATPNQVQHLPPYYNPVKLTTCGCLCELCSKCKK